MKLSKHVLSVQPSATLAIGAKAKEMKAQGVDVISLSAGEPDFDTPNYIKAAAVKALDSGQTKYTPAVGTPDLRKVICHKLLKDQGLSYDPKQIIVSSGAKHSVFNVLYALLNEGDKVIIPTPYWLSYPEMVTLLGAKSDFIPTTEATGFKITPDQLEQAITEKSKVFILNSPSNPTGAVYTKGELEALAKVVKQHPELVVISDEIYEKLIFDGIKHYSIAQLDNDVAKQTVIINGFSKAYSMTGWRLGYAACPNLELAKAISSLQSHSTSNPTSFAQPGGVAAMQQGEEDANKMCGIFQKRRDFFISKLKEIPKLKVVSPQGAFYIFANIRDTGLNSLEVAERLLDEAHVAVVPGKPFGSDQNIRLSFASSEAQLEEASKRLLSWFQKLS